LDNYCRPPTLGGFHPVHYGATNSTAPPISTVGKWRHDPTIAGDGCHFDMGSHMANTVVDLIGQDVVEVCALMGQCGTRVDINSTLSGRFRYGEMATKIANAERLWPSPIP